MVGLWVHTSTAPGEEIPVGGDRHVHPPRRVPLLVVMVVVVQVVAVVQLMVVAVLTKARVKIPSDFGGDRNSNQ